MTLETKGLVYTYGKHLVLDGVDLHVNEGEILGILGPNGCGKTTMLKNLNRNLSPMEGCVLLDGEDLEEISKKDIARKMAVVPQTNEIRFAFSVRDMVAMGRMPFQSMMGGASSEDERIVDEAIELTGLSGMQDRLINTMSGGERQRVIIARAIAQTPRIILMDEPFGALDAQTRNIMQEQLTKIIQHSERTIIFVTHSVEEALFLSDRVVVLTKRPSTIYKVIDVPWDRPRDRASPEFTALRKQILTYLEQQNVMDD